MSTREKELLEHRDAKLTEPVRFLDERLGAARGARFLINYVFPDHWSFMLGEIALYSFVVLVLTGIYLAFFFTPSYAHVTYNEAYAPLRGQEMTEAYWSSALYLSFKVSGGLLMRQTHHWAADLFIASITAHLLRIVFTGAFRKPRDINFYIGVTMLILALLEGYCGYSLPADLLSGMGLVIGWAVLMSVPFIGGPLASALWGGVYPGTSAFEGRLFITHVLIVPLILAALISVHLVIIMRQHHSQFRGPGRTERNVVGTPMWPGYALRSIGLFLATCAVLVLLGGLVEINPIWLWGPYHTWVGTSGAQPDWYLGWLIGALRMMPNWEIHLWSKTVVPNPFFGGVLYPGLIFMFLYSLPWLDRRFFTKDHRRHELLDRPRDNPKRTGLIAAVFANVIVVFIAGSADRLFFRFHYGYEGGIWFFRGAWFLLPPAVYFATVAVCKELKRREVHPLREWSGSVIARKPDGGFEHLRPGVGWRPGSGRPGSGRPGSGPPAGHDAGG